MTRFIFFTKTNWSEPPRLRHQLARLLVGAGYEVLFFQKPSFLFQRTAPSPPREQHIQFFSHKELLHHKLRFPPLAQSINAAWTKISIQKTIANLCISKEDVVVNFNYEYFFLRDIFPQNKIITVLNDDFISTAWPVAKPALTNALKITCAMSDKVLAVSTRLQEQVDSVCNPRLFLPWSDCSYCAPKPSTTRDTLFFWGYINRKIDYEFVRRLAQHLMKIHPKFKLLFVGPIETAVTSSVNSLRSEKNIHFLPASKLDQLELDQIFGSLIPYRSNDGELDAIMLPNKALQIFARGIPIFITGMPDFMRLPFVFPLRTPECGDLLLDIRNKFDSLQPDIKNFVELNRDSARLQQFLDIVNF